MELAQADLFCTMRALEKAKCSGDPIDVQFFNCLEVAQTRQ